MKLMAHLMNFLKISMKIISVKNKILKIIVIKSKKIFNKIHNNLICYIFFLSQIKREVLIVNYN